MPLRSRLRLEARRLLLAGGLALGCLTIGPASNAAAFAPCATPRGSHTSPAFANAHPRVLLANEATISCLRRLLAEGAPSATRFREWVDEELSNESDPSYVVGEPRAYGFAAWYAAALGQITGDPKYCSFAVRSAEHAVAGEEASIAAGEPAGVAFDSYLYVGERIGDVALVYDWCHAQITQAQRDRWIAYMNQAVWNVWHPDQASWGGRSYPWTGWSIDNPSNNYYYSFLRATMLLGLATRGEDPQAQTWIDTFRTTKIQNQLIPTFVRDLPGGGSREGTGYGTAMDGLYGLMDWWERSTGERIADLTPHGRESLAWMTHAIVPSLDRLVPIGDHPRDSSAALFDYHREYLLVLMSLYAGTRDASVADQVLDASTTPRMQYGFNFWVDYFYEPAVQQPAALSDYGRTHMSPGSGLLTTRDSWTNPKSAFASLMCGPFTESHAHQEQGSFQLFAGEWLAPTGNRYSHSGLMGTPEFKNLVRFESSGGETIQQDGADPACRMTALHDAADYTYASIDVADAYASNSNVQQAQREFLFVRPSTLIVFDRVQSTAGTKRIWTLNLQGSPSAVSSDHLTYVGDENASDRLDVDRISPAGLSYAVSPMDWLWDGPVDPADASRRVDVVDASGTQTRFLHVLNASTNGAPAATGIAADNTTGMTGVHLTLADGRTVVARFANAAPGGTISVTPPGGSPIPAPLATTVQQPALFATAGTDRTDGFASADPTVPGSMDQPAGTTPSGNGAPPADARWLVAPKLRGRALRVGGVYVRRSGAQCPSSAKVSVTSRGRRLGARTVKLRADGVLCRLAASTVRLPRSAKSVKVIVSGKGIQRRTWSRVPAAK